MSNAISWIQITKLYNNALMYTIVVSVLGLMQGVALFFSNLLFIKVGYELVKRQILCFVGFPKLLHHLEI